MFPIYYFTFCDPKYLQKVINGYNKSLRKKVCNNGYGNKNLGKPYNCVFFLKANKILNNIS